VIVPVLNERQNLPKLIERLGHFFFEEIIVVDGGSDDGSWELIQELAINSQKIKAAQSSAGRSSQMNAGAKVTESEYLLFLHADTQLPEGADQVILQSLATNLWGRFDIQFIEASLQLSVIAWFINFRSRTTGVATGDQAFFIRRNVFEQLTGFADIPLMEDVELSKRLKKLGKPACSRRKVTTSARRWLTMGVWKTVFLMWKLRFYYFIGVDPHNLAKIYRQVR